MLIFFTWRPQSFDVGPKVHYKHVDHNGMFGIS